MALLRGGRRVVVCSGRVGCGGRVVRLALELGIVLLGQPLDCVATHRWLEHVVAVEGELLEARVEHGRDEPELLDRIGQLGVEACDQATVVELARLPDLDSTSQHYVHRSQLTTLLLVLGRILNIKLIVVGKPIVVCC